MDMIYAKESRQNADGTTSVVITSTVTPSQLRELGIMPTPEKSDTGSSGICVVCKGDLQEKIRYEDAPRERFLPVEPQEEVIEVKDGYFCVECGLRYEFIPNLRQGLL